MKNGGVNYVLVMLWYLQIQPTVSEYVDNSGILASTLFTFHDHACDNEKMNIRCPFGTTINIQWAQYGRQLPSQQMCPYIHSFWPPDHGYVEDTNCLATTSLKIVYDKCQDHQQCRLYASAQSFGTDPCPGTSKYLEVAYKCRPKEFRSRVTCENEEMGLQCQRRLKLAIYSAMFGRTPEGTDECPSGPSYDTECQARCAMEKVMKKCHGKRKCQVQASDEVFGNPCRTGTPKYLSVVYTCVPRKILKEMAVEEAFPYSFCDGDPRDNDDGIFDDGSIHEASWENIGGGNSGKRKNGDDTIINGAPARQPSTIRTKATTTSIGLTYTVRRPMSGNRSNSDITPAVAPVQNEGINFVTDWLFTWNFIRDHQELFILYATVSILIGFILLLLVIIIRLAVTRHRQKSRAKLDISEPVPTNTLNRQHTMGGGGPLERRPEDVALLSNQDITDSSDGGGVDVLSFHQHSSYNRNNHYNTTPKTFGNPNNNNNAAVQSIGGGPYGGSGTITMTTASPFTNQYRTSPGRTQTLPRYESQGSRTFDNYYR